MFTPLVLNHTHNIRAATNHLLYIPQKQNTHYETCSMTSITSSSWNDLQRNTNEKNLEWKISKFKRSYSKHTLISTAMATKLLKHYLTKTLFITNSVRCFSFFLIFICSTSIVIIISSLIFNLFSLLAKILIVRIISSAHGTIIQTGIACKKIPCYAWLKLQGFYC